MPKDPEVDQGDGTPNGADAPEQPATGTMPDIYVCLGTYPPYDARRVLEAFEDAKVRYTLDPGRLGGDQATTFGASYGAQSTAFFGSHEGLTIGVQKEDLARAISIRNRVLKIEV